MARRRSFAPTTARSLSRTISSTDWPTTTSKRSISRLPVPGKTGSWRVSTAASVTSVSIASSSGYSPRRASSSKTSGRTTTKPVPTARWLTSHRSVSPPSSLPQSIAPVGLRPPSAMDCQPHTSPPYQPTSRTNTDPGPNPASPSSLFARSILDKATGNPRWPPCCRSTLHGLARMKRTVSAKSGFAGASSAGASVTRPEFPARNG